MAICGHNGNNETQIGVSNSVGLTFYDNNLDEIKIFNTQSPIDLIIQRDVNLPPFTYQYVNVTQLQDFNENFILPISIKLTSKKASLHIEIKPLNLNIGYMVVFKLGYLPIVNSKINDFTSLKIFCPGKIKFYKKTNPISRRSPF